MSLHQQLDSERLQAREHRRQAVRLCLREVLTRQLPRGTQVWLYGSLTQPGRFHDYSDIDLAICDPEERVHLSALQSAISAATHLEADVSRLSETRLARHIQRQGEPWIL